MDYKKLMFTGAVILAVSGCEQPPAKTDSMIRRDNATSESAALVTKAQELVTPTTFSTPQNHLDELVMIQGLLRDAKEVYREAKITNWNDPELTSLEAQIISINRPLALSSLEAFDTAISKSVKFKKKKQSVESLPVYDNTLAKQALFTHLKEFNSDLESCCLDKILLINRFLRTEAEKYYSTIKLGHNTLHYMGKLIRDEVSEAELRQRVSAEESKIKSMEPLTASTDK